VFLTSIDDAVVVVLTITLLICVIVIAGLLVLVVILIRYSLVHLYAPTSVTGPYKGCIKPSIKSSKLGCACVCVCVCVGASIFLCL